MESLEHQLSARKRENRAVSTVLLRQALEGGVESRHLDLFFGTRASARVEMDTEEKSTHYTPPVKTMVSLYHLSDRDFDRLYSAIDSFHFDWLDYTSKTNDTSRWGVRDFQKNAHDVFSSTMIEEFSLEFEAILLQSNQYDDSKELISQAFGEESEDIPNIPEEKDAWSRYVQGMKPKVPDFGIDETREVTMEQICTDMGLSTFLIIAEESK